MSAGLRWRIRWRLSVLWALEWSITGAILTYLPLYFTERGLSLDQLGQLMAVSAVGLWVAPFVVGQLCDRWLATEKYLAIAHFIGGLTLFSIPIVTDTFQKTGEGFAALLFLVGLFALVYFPTIPLASSMTFRHLTDPDSQFGAVRIWGTLGWVLAGLFLSLWLGRVEALAWLEANVPSAVSTVHAVEEWTPLLPSPSSADCFRIAALLSFALSSFCVFLPATPPARAEKGSVAPLQTLSMFRDRTFTLLIATSFLLATVVPLYSLAVPQLLEQQLGFDRDWIPAVMTIGQISEFPALLLLPFFLKRFGLKTTFAIGMAAWFLRYAMFALNLPTLLVFSAIGLHGVCHVFLIIVIQLYVDSQCRSDLRASAQNLFAFITMGIAMPVGFLVGGKFAQWTGDGPEINFQLFFAVPAVIILGLLIIYWRWFRFPEERSTNDPSDAAEAHSEPLPSEAPGLAGSK